MTANIRSTTSTETVLKERRGIPMLIRTTNSTDRETDNDLLKGKKKTKETVIEIERELLVEIEISKIMGGRDNKKLWNKKIHILKGVVRFKR